MTLCITLWCLIFVGFREGSWTISPPYPQLCGSSRPLAFQEAGSWSSRKTGVMARRSGHLAQILSPTGSHPSRWIELMPPAPWGPSTSPASHWTQLKPEDQGLWDCYLVHYSVLSRMEGELKNFRPRYSPCCHSRMAPRIVFQIIMSYLPGGNFKFFVLREKSKTKR